MSAHKQATEMHPAAQRLARALRSGLELRWSVPAPSINTFPPGGQVRPFLEPYADSLHFPLAPRRNPLHRLIRALHYLIRKLIAPWLHVQTHFNLSTVGLLEHVEQRVRALEDAELALSQTVKKLEKRLLSGGDGELVRSIDTLEEGFRLRVNQELSRQGNIGQAATWFESPVRVHLGENGPRIADVSSRILEQIFVHTHLPRPPARLLALGCSDGTNAIEMAGLGFQVFGVDGRPLLLGHPNLTMMRTQSGQLPFEDESFDGAVALSTRGRLGCGWWAAQQHDASDEQVLAEVFRVLKRGGRFLLTVPFGQRTGASAQHVYDRAQLDRLLHAFRLVERGYGLRDGDSWSFTLDEQRAEQADSSAGVRAVCLLVLEKA
jgi:SAM-dependent methyltransferase